MLCQVKKKQDGIRFEKNIEEVMFYDGIYKQ